MKFCVSCGSQLDNGAKFCVKCGASQPETKQETGSSIHPEIQVNNQATSQPQSSQDQPVNPMGSFQQESTQQPHMNQASENGPSTTQTINEALKNNENIQQIKSQSKNYFGWLVSNTKNPQIGKTTNSPIFGLVNYGLLALITTLTLYRITYLSITSLIVSGLMDDLGFPLFFETLIGLLILLIMPVLVVYIVADKIYHDSVTFLQAFDRVFAPISLAIFISFTALILSLLLGIKGFIFWLIIIPFGLVSYSYAGNIWVTTDQTQNKNRFYTSVITFIIAAIFFFIAFLIAGGIFGEGILSILSQGIESTIDSLFYPFN